MKYPLSDAIYRGWYNMPKLWSDFIVSNENARNFHGSEKILNFLLTAQNKTRFDGPKLFSRSFYSMLDFYDRKKTHVSSYFQQLSQRIIHVFLFHILFNCPGGWTTSAGKARAIVMVSKK